MNKSLLRLLIVGLVCFVTFLLLPKHPKLLILVGSVMWLSGLVVALVRLYTKNAALPTFVGWVSRENRPIFYVWLYLIMFLFGIGIVVITASFLINLFPVI